MDDKKTQQDTKRRELVFTSDSKPYDEGIFVVNGKFLISCTPFENEAEDLDDMGYDVGNPDAIPEEAWLGTAYSYWRIHVDPNGRGFELSNSTNDPDIPDPTGVWTDVHSVRDCICDICEDYNRYNSIQDASPVVVVTTIADSCPDVDGCLGDLLSAISDGMHVDPPSLDAAFERIKEALVENVATLRDILVGGDTPTLAEATDESSRAMKNLGQATREGEKPIAQKR